MTSDFLYLDWAATAPLSVAAAEAMEPFLTPGIEGIVRGSANANSLYTVGRDAFRLLEAARKDIGRAMGGARPDEVIFTSGATEADNAALFGITDALMMRADQSGDHGCVPKIIVSSIEHDAVLAAARLLNTWGAQIVLVDPDSSGCVSPEALEEVIDDETILVSIMTVNNEVGSVMDVGALARVAHERGALFHTDATQALGKIPLDVKGWNVDALSLSAHKVGGPKGVGALYLKARTPFSAQMVGGGQESAKRSGTQNVCGACGFAAAARQAVAELGSEPTRLRNLRDRCYRALLENPHVEPSVPWEKGDMRYAPHIVNVLVEGMESETLILDLDNRGVCVSGGSACSSHSLDPSHVLSALGIERKKALGSLRVSLGRSTTDEDIDRFVAIFNSVVR